MTRPEVSVVIPTRDRPAFLRQAVRSVLAQKDVGFEVVVVDDGSTDHSQNVLDALNDDRVKLVAHDRSHGVSAARNTGVDMADGTWVAFLDDDDLLAPDHLASQLGALRRHDAVWSCAGQVAVCADLEVIGSSDPPDARHIGVDLQLSNVIPSPACVLAAKRAVDDAGRFDTNFSCYADWDLWVRLAREGPFTTVPRPLVAYRVHGRNMSGDAGLWEAELARLRQKHGAADRSVDRRRALARQRAEAWNLLRAGRPSQARSNLVELARTRRDWRAALLAAGMLAAPQHLIRLDAARSRRQVPLAWRREVEGWLGSLRAQVG